MKTIDEMLGDFSPAKSEKSNLTNGKTVTIWVSPEMKARYDSLQEKSGRRFGKKARELLLALIEAAEAKTA